MPKNHSKYQVSSIMHNTKYLIHNTFTQRPKTRTLIALGLLILLVPIALFTLFRPSDSSAAWFDDSYTYRKKTTFTHNTLINEERRISVTVDTSALISISKMQADCDDTRFTDINGKLLRFQEVSGCNTTTTQYDVVVNSVLNSQNVLFIYYGNPGASNGSEDVSEVTSLSPSGGSPSLANEQKGIAPAAYWAMNEGSGNNVHDGTTNGNNGIVEGATWQRGDMCVVDKCLRFDGEDDVITVTNTDSIDVEKNLSQGFTYEAWVRPNGAGEDTGGQIFYKSTNTWLKVSNLSNGMLDLSASTHLSVSDATVTASAKVTDNQWNLIAVSYTNDGDDEITIWVNGEAVGTSTNGSGNPVNE